MSTPLKVAVLLASALTALAGPSLLSDPGFMSAAAFAKSGSDDDGGFEDDIEDDIEDDVEDAVEDRVEKGVEDDIEDDVEDKVEDDVEDKVEDDVEDKVEDDVEDKVEDGIEDHVESDIEDDIENDVEDGVEDEVDDKVEDEVEDELESDAEDEIDVEDRLADRLESDALVDEELADNELFDAREDIAKAENEAGRDKADADRKAARAAAKAAMESALELPGADRDALKEQYDREKDAADAARDAARSAAEAARESERSDTDARKEDAKDDDDGDGGDDRGESFSDSAIERVAFRLGQDETGAAIAEGEWLVIAPASVLGELERQGYLARQVEDLSALGMVLVRIEAPASLSLTDVEAAIRNASPEAAIDYNHVYTPGAAASGRASDGSPADLFSLPPTHDGAHKIGVIDTAVEVGHPVFSAAEIVVQDFVPYAYQRPLRHGTSVVSILAGKSDDYRGLAPNAKIFAASVFFETPSGGQTATTASLVRALAWMIDNEVSVVNMSLTGPSNEILKAAIDRAVDRGLVIVAASGNAGPAAAPLFPAAYENVVAVTAIGQNGKVYRLANRGEHIDFAAPGVAIRHADEQGGFAESSGTSMAAPFVAALLALTSDEDGKFAKGRLQDFARNAVDLGAPGFDPIYGHGLIRPLPRGGADITTSSR